MSEDLNPPTTYSYAWTGCEEVSAVRAVGSVATSCNTAFATGSPVSRKVSTESADSRSSDYSYTIRQRHWWWRRAQAQGRRR